LAIVAAMRHCTKTGCAERAAVTLTYEYGAAVAWLDDLHHDRDPHVYDLCERHASRVSVPNGWRLVDRRSHALIAFPQHVAV
jgi:hypothetical protein